jgi:hypothetical protein
MDFSAALLLLASTQVSAPPFVPFGGWQVVGVRGVSAGSAICCDIAADPHGVVHVAYQDQILVVDPATVQQFLGGAWRPVGVAGGASIRQAWYDHLAFDNAGEPILACRDYGVNGKLNVRSYTTASNTWNEVGPAGASAGEAHYTDIATGSDGSPWVVYADRTTTPVDRATVLHFTGGVWNVVGAVGFSDAEAQYTSIAVGARGVPYVAFTDRARLDSNQTGRVTVMKYDAASNGWIAVGPPGFSPTGGVNTRIALDRSGAPCVAYQQYHIAIRVWRFDGAQWQSIGGSASGSDRPTLETEAWRQWLSLAFDSHGAPYVAYQMLDFGHSASVRRFDGAQWVPVGRLGFTPPNADYLAMTVDPFDTTWVVFRNAALGGRATVMRIVSQ